MNNSKVPIFLFIFFFFIFQNATAQPAIEFAKSFGGGGSDAAMSVRQTMDGGYIVAGRSGSNDSWMGNHGSVDSRVVRLDVNGDSIWARCFGGDSIDAFTSVIQTSDGGFALCGHSKSNNDDLSLNHVDINGDPTYDAMVIRLDSGGNILWTHLYGSTSGDSAKVIFQTPDGGFLVGCHSSSPAGGDKTQDNWSPGARQRDFWVFKIDSTGDKQWDQRLGTLPDDELWDAFTPSGNGTFVVGGTTWGGISGNKTQDSRGLTDFWVVKSDSTGTVIWDKRYGGNREDGMFGLDATMDNGFILAGYTKSDPDTIGGKTDTLHYNGVNPSVDCWMVKIDSMGNRQWDKSFGGTLNDYIYSVKQTPDGGYILGGRSNSNNFDVTGNHGLEDFWIVKTDPFGNLKWQKSIGGTAVEYPNSIIVTSDTGYAVVGQSRSNDNDITGNHGSDDFCVVKLGTFPASSFSANQDTICANTAVQFINYSTGATSYSWNFGDGNLSVLVNPSHVYSTAGTFTVTLTATSVQGSDVMIRTNFIVVIPAPDTAHAGPDQTNSLTCGLDTVTLNANDPVVGAGVWSILSGAGGSFVNSGQYNTDFSGVPGTNYQLRWTISNGLCPASTDNMNVLLNVLPVVNITGGPYGPYCRDENAVTLTGNQSSGIFSGNGISGNQFSPSAVVAGTHPVIYSYTDPATGCTENDTIQIIVRNAPALSLSTHLDVVCHGDNTGSATVSVSSGTSPFNYVWTPSGDTAVSASNLSAGTYSVRVTDANSCNDTLEIIIDEPDSAIVLSTSSTPAACGQDDGTASVIASGGVGPFTFLWSDSLQQTSATATNLPAGLYVVTVTDDTGCVKSINATVSNVSGPVVTLGNVTPVTCFGGSNGSAAVTVTGSGPFTYLWSTTPAQTTATATNLSAGSYSVAVTDTDLCVTTMDSIDVNEPPQIFAVAGSDTSICPGGTTTIGDSAAGGVGNFSYSWSPSANLSSATAIQPLASPAITTTYTVTVTDGNSCTATDQVEVTVLPLPAVNIINGDTSVCPGTVVHLSADAGLSAYSWSQGSTGTTIDITITADITIILTGTDANGCTGTDEINITAGGGGTFPAAINTETNYQVPGIVNNTLCDMTYNFLLGVDPNTSLIHEWQIINPSGNPVNTFYASPDQSHVSFNPVLFGDTGMYHVTLEVSSLSGGCSETLHEFIYVDDNSFTHDSIVIWHHVLNGNDALVCLDNSANFYQWGYDDPVSWTPHPLSGETFQDYLFGSSDPFTPASKFYWVVTYYGSCFIKTYFSGPLAGRHFQPAAVPGWFSVYPNPGSGPVTVSLSRAVKGKLKAEITDELGRRIASKDFSEAETSDMTVIIDPGNTAEGVYFLRVWDDRQHHAVKIIRVSQED